MGSPAGSQEFAGRTRWWAATAAVATLLTVLLYGVTVGYGFHYDDYHFVHPYRTAEVLASFHGPWDVSGIETAYYRPLTICLYALRFAALGLDAHAAHVLSLIMFALAASLFAWFVMQICGSRAAGPIAAAAFVVHPGMPYSAVAWVTNQMHLAGMIVVFASALWWFHVRRRTAWWWMPLLLGQAAAFLIKEDGIMLIPALVVLHVLRKRLVERELPPLPWTFLVAAAIAGGGLLLLRSSALHRVPSHHLPSFDQAWSNWVRGLGVFRLVPAKRPWQPTASWFVTLVPLAAVVLWRRVPAGARFAMVAGVLLGVLFDLPFAFIVKAEQVHLVTASAALLLAGAITGIFHALPARPVRMAWLAVAVAGLAAMAAVARDITRDFEPFGPIVLRTDRIVEDWAAVPVEIRDYLAAKASADPASRPDPDPSRVIPLVSYGFHGWERSPDGIALRWMADPAADVFVRRGTRLLSFAVRHEIGAFREPAHVRIEADGRLVTELVLTDGRWRQIDVPLRQRAWTGPGGMHRLRIRLDRAWVPSLIIPGSGDARTLGLQVGAFQLR